MVWEKTTGRYGCKYAGLILITLGKVKLCWRNMGIIPALSTASLPGSPQIPVVSGEDFMKVTSLVGISLKLLYAWSAILYCTRENISFFNNAVSTK